MIDAVLLGIIAMVCFGIVEIAMKRVTEHLGTRALVFYRGIGMVTFLSLFAFLLPFPLVMSWHLLFIMLPSLFFGSVAFYAFTHALKLGKVSVMSPVAHGAPALTVLLAVLFYQEQLTPFQGFGILLVILGTIFVSFKWQELKSLQLHDITKGLPYALLAFLGWGLTFFFYKVPVDIAGPMLPAILMDGTLFLSAAVTLPFKNIMMPTKKQAWLLLFVGFFSAIAFTSFSLGISTGLLSIVTPIVYASPFVTIILARLFLKETLEINQYIGIMSILVGVVLLAL